MVRQAMGIAMAIVVLMTMGIVGTVVAFVVFQGRDITR
jgi:hypothetical protein